MEENVNVILINGNATMLVGDKGEKKFEVAMVNETTGVILAPNVEQAPTIDELIQLINVQFPGIPLRMIKLFPFMNKTDQPHINLRWVTKEGVAK
tara:strand:- start:373 stop:657 length:285 start_codon:yes stop_codon:yes gene_type:complete